MKITYSEFKARLLRGRYECTKIQLEGLYTRYQNDTAPVWVVECLQPAKPKPEKVPAGRSRADFDARESQILDLLEGGSMFLDELIKRVGLSENWLRRIMQKLTAAGEIVAVVEPVTIQAGNRMLLSYKKRYSMNWNKPKCSQNHAECLSDAQKVKVYRKECEGCLYANEAVCCGGVR